MFAPLIPEPCSECKARICDLPYGIDTKGFSSRHPDTAPDIVARWPRCPRNWDVLYRCGVDLIPPSDVVQWAWEQGAQRDPMLPAGGARLLREWRRIRDIPGKLLEIRAHEERKRGKV